MTVFTGVGKELSVGADPEPVACAGHDLVVLASADHQHAGDRFPCEVARIPLPDEDEPMPLATMKRVLAMAERVAYAMAPMSVPLDVWRRLSPKGPDRLVGDPEAEVKSKRVLITCDEGLNRSLLIAGMALVLAGEQEDGKSARLHLQELRGDRAFRNAHMRRSLDSFYPASLRDIRMTTADKRRVYGPDFMAGKEPGGFVVR